MSGKDSEKCLKKTNLLVYQQPSGGKHRREPCSSGRKKPAYIPTICRPNPKVIRICTGAEMKKMCAPKPCVCPKGRRPSKGLLGLLVFGMKTALAAAAVYVSYDLGIWGSTDDTQELYRMYCRMKNEPNRKNTGKWDPPSCEAERDLFRISPFNPYGQCDDPPFDHERKAYNFQNNWNHAVAYVFAGIAGLPYNIIEKFTKEKPDGDSVKKNVCVPFEDLPENERIINKYK
ncbi:unnamed protein product [Phaedon cochleariae]|uniref:MICOS complex subunit MIC13 n=1 Tax=Phaedon cochleariae TaxID=80249 RepID=A0A9P0GVL3_PHACE|nr:unnamed protein product [Phaedon cochleariae]